MQLASELGTLLASETPCGFAYDQAAIQTYIDKNVPTSEMGFAPMLDMMVMGAEQNFSDMTESTKVAHCRAIEGTARHYGFIN
jgi:hypothetical protein